MLYHEYIENNNGGKNMILKGFIKEAINKRKAIYLLMIVIITMGFMNYNSISKSLLPQAEFPYVSIYTEMIGASPKTVEQDLTNILEQELNDLKDVIEMKSTSAYSHSLIIIKFRENVEIESQIQMIQRRIDNINHRLPELSKKSIVEPFDINNFPVIMIELENKLPVNEQMQVYEKIKRHISGIPGVSKVEANGLDKLEIEVIPDKGALNKYSITETEVIETIKSSNMNLPIGSVAFNGQSYNFQMSNKINDISEFESILVRFDDNKPIYLRDISDVQLVRKKNMESYKIDNNESKPIVLISIFKDQASDAVTINKQIHEYIKAFNKDNQYGINLSTALDLSKYITKSINDVINNAIGGLLSVIVVLFFFIGLREAFIASTVIPITLMSTFLLFDFFDITLNIFSIMGLIIALGMLVDNAIVVIEMIDENKKHNRDMSIQEIVIQSTTKVAPAILASTVTTILALLPLSLMKGDIGHLIREIPLAAMIAMGISFITSITITPIFASQWIKHNDENKYKKLTLIIITVLSMFALSKNYHWTKLSYGAGFFVFILGYFKLFKEHTFDFIDAFENFIRKVLNTRKRRYIVLFMTFILFIASIGLLLSDYIQKEAMPESDDINFLGKIELNNGSVISDSRELADQINDYLIESGTINKMNYSYNDKEINYVIELKDKENRQQHSKDIIKAFNHYISKLPDVHGRFSSDGEGGNENPISLRLLGDNHQTLTRYANSIVTELKNIEGVIDPKVNTKMSRETFDISINFNKCRVYKVDPMSVMLKLRYLTTGEEITKIDNEITDMKAVLRHRFSLSNERNIKDIMVLNNVGYSIPLIEIVDIQKSRHISGLRHYNEKKSIEITSDHTSDSNTNLIVNKLIEKIEEKELLPDTIDLEIGGESKEMNDTFSDLFEKMLIAGILVYIVLVLQFNSYMQPFAIVLSIPYAIIGVVLGFVVFDLTFSTLSFLGIVALVGIAVNDAIVLIDYINNLRVKHSIGPIESIVQGAKSRFIPIIATSLTTIAGVIPLAFYNEDYSGMAYAIVFGLMFSTILTLVVMPVTLVTLDKIIDSIHKGVIENA